MFWILAILIVVSIIIIIKAVFSGYTISGCFIGVTIVLLLIVSCFLSSESQKDVTFLAKETGSSSTTSTIETFEQQISYNRDEKNYEITVQVKEPTEVVITEIEYFSMVTFQTNTLYSYYFM